MFVRKPVPSPDYLIFHHCDVGGWSPESNCAKLQEKEGEFLQVWIPGCVCSLLRPELRESNDHRPEPAKRRKSEPRSIDQSVRASCAIAQKPLSIRIGIFVVEIATSILIMRGMAARCVNSPRSTSNPQTISTTPTKGAIISGAGIPILMNRPTPSESEKRNFWMPSERKTHPTIN